MKNEELKQALQSGEPVIFTNTDGREIEYDCVSAIVYRMNENKITISVELLDKNKWSVIVCDPEKVRQKGSA